MERALEKLIKARRDPGLFTDIKACVFCGSYGRTLKTGLQRDLRADPFLGEYFQEQGVGDAAVNDVDL